MIRGVMFFFMVWVLVSAFLYGASRSNTDVKKVCIRAVVYGFATALLAAVIVTMMVVVF